MNLTTAIALVGELITLVGIITPILINMGKIKEGTKCQLRSEMLRIYYHNHEKETIRQYELENFIMLYEAYKALKGNSFIDKIYREVLSWEVIS